MEVACLSDTGSAITCTLRTCMTTRITCKVQVKFSVVERVYQYEFDHLKDVDNERVTCPTRIHSV